MGETWRRQRPEWTLTHRFRIVDAAIKEYYEEEAEAKKAEPAKQ